MAANSGYAHGVIDTTMHSVKPTANHMDDTGIPQEHHTVVVWAHDTSVTPDAAGETAAMLHPRARTHLLVSADVELLVRVAASSPDAAGICARCILPLKRYATRLEAINELLQTVIDWREGRGFRNGREGGRNKEEVA
ncbi:hypothetical protein FN846DRAFT_886243 [Sphaerosporella brunnea]|uniref:Uncharacterized protein n=1 Tax=Sphaerosporella brunnea TaxID=1250544 RepID=A0A5J5FAX4_9PEZI|nr:hypothetical protein FN846DRAFT_886243 [Sphaerosporella brunnea]